MPMTTNLRHRIVPMTLLAGLAIAGIGTALTPGRAQAEPPKAKSGKAKAVIPFEMLPTNHMVVRARINGKGPFRLVFDVGAPITLLGNKAAVASGVIQANAPRALLFSIRGEAEVTTLEVGDLTVKDLPVIVLDHPILKALGEVLGKPLDGIIGYTLFARYRTTIDYQARRMTFEPVDFAVRNLIRDLPDRLVGPKVAKHRVLAPGALWGLTVGEPEGDLSSPGVPVRSVLPDSPAAAAGVRPGDVLTTVDGRWTTSINDTYAAAATVAPGQSVPVVVLRDGQELTLMIQPVEGF